MQLTFEGETLADILPQVRQFLHDASVSPTDALLAMDEPLPPAVKRPSKQREGSPTPGQIAAAREAQAPQPARSRDPLNLFD